MKLLQLIISFCFLLSLRNAAAQTILYEPDTTYNYYFALSIELSGKYLFVSGDMPTNQGDKSVIYVYQLRDTIPTLIDTFYQLEYNLLLLSAYGPYCAVSAQHNALATGSVMIYHLENGKWKFVQMIQASDGAGYNGFGVSDIYKDEMIVGAPGDNMNALGSGAAYVYRLENNQWIEKQKLKPNGLQPGDYFGATVRIYKDQAIIGSQNVQIGTGKAYIYKKTDTTWVLKQIIDHGNITNERFAASAVISDNYTLIGAPDKEIQWSSQGMVYHYKNTDTAFVNEKTLLAPDALFLDHFGSDIDNDERYFAVGALGKNNDRGKVYLYHYKNDTTLPLINEFYPKDNLYPYRLGGKVKLAGSILASTAYVVGSPAPTRHSVYLFQQCGIPLISSFEDNPVCPGDSVHLQAGCPKDSVNWFNSSGLLLADSRHYNFIASGSDTVWAEIWTKGVFTGYTGADTIVVQAGPQPDFQTDSVCPNQITHFTDLSFTGTAVARYFWDFDNDGITDDTLPGSTTHTYQAPGFYQAKLKIINSYGCADSLVKTVWVKNCTGIEERHAIASLTIAPNPNRGTFRLTIRVNEPTTAQIQLTDLSGKLVLTRKVTLGPGTQTLWIDAGRPAPGVYFLSMQTGREVMNRKVVLY